MKYLTKGVMVMDAIDPPIMLQYLDAILKHGTFTKAAKELYISQPYLTQTIKKTEKTLGIDIINRQVSPLQLTEAGNIYYQYLNSVELRQDSFLKQIDGLTHPDKASVRIGILSSLGTYLLPLMIPKLISQCPELKIEVIEDLAVINEHKVLNGEINFLIGQNPETISPNLSVHSFGSQSYFAIIPPSSSLYIKDKLWMEPNSIAMDQLLSQPLVLTSRGSAIRRQVDFLLKTHSITPNIVFDCRNIFTVAELAKNGCGSTFLPESTLAFHQFDHCNIYPLGKDSISLKYFIAYPLKKTLSPEEIILVNLFKQIIS